VTDEPKAWRCVVCGYVHRGPEPPETCPICSASRDKFEPYKDASAESSGKIDRLRCSNCNHVHVGAKPPAECPVCGAGSDRFEPLGEVVGQPNAARAVKAVVVGAGIAGLSAAESLRALSPEAEITLLSRETELPYFRLNLTRYLAGEVGERELPIHPAAWYEEKRIRLLLGAEVSAIALNGQTVILREGAKEPFEKLILAAGASPFVPPIAGADREGVTALRTRADAERILDAAKRGARCLCLGGGTLGLETAGALARRGADVTVLEELAWLMPRQLNQRAAAILADHVARLGVKLRTRTTTSEILGDKQVRGVRLEDKTLLAAELVVITTGVRSNSYLARLAGLDVRQGVVVDNFLTTSHPNVLAAGDMAEHGGIVYGTWGASQFQGSIAGMNAAGGRVEFGGIPRSNTLKVLDLDLFSIGQVEPEDASVLEVQQETDGKYFRFLFRDNQLRGAILLGDARLTAAVKRAVETKADFSAVLARHPSAADVLDYLAESLV